MQIVLLKHKVNNINYIGKIDNMNEEEYPVGILDGSQSYVSKDIAKEHPVAILDISTNNNIIIKMNIIAAANTPKYHDGLPLDGVLLSRYCLL